jgi:hypothetical protein
MSLRAASNLFALFPYFLNGVAEADIRERIGLPRAATIAGYTTKYQFN